tara:strand:- start:322 stop:741 length:420 start_codon:yes stop_codon:yes gene_type:complete
MKLYENNKFKLLGLIAIPSLFYTTKFLKNKIYEKIQYNKKYKEDILIFKNIDPTHFSFLIKNIKEQTKNNKFKTNIYILCQDEYMVKIPYNTFEIKYNNNLYKLKPLLNKYSNIIGYKISTYSNELDEFIISLCSQIII